MKVLILGGGGMAEGIAKALDNEDYEYKVMDKSECDVTYHNRVCVVFETEKPDVVIVTAGVSNPNKIEHTYVDEEISVNVIGAFQVAREAANNGVKTIIFIASVAGLYGKPNHSGYSASKAAVISLVQSLGMEGHDAYAISPGRVDTPMREKDYPNDTPGSRLTVEQIGDVVIEILNGDHTPGDNIIIRKKGLKQIIRQTDDGEPWKTRLEVGKPVTI